MSKQAPESELSSLPELVPAEEAARVFGLEVNSLKEVRRAGVLAPARTVIGRKPFYAREDVVSAYHERERRQGARISRMNEARKKAERKRAAERQSATEAVREDSQPPRPVGVQPPNTSGKRPVEIAESYARHFATLLTFEEPESPQWRFLLGQLSAAATLANVLRR